MNIDLDKVTCGDRAKRRKLEEELWKCDHEAYVAWEQTTMDKVAGWVKIPIVLLLIVVWFVELGWLKIACIALLALLLAVRFVNRRMRSKYIDNQVNNSLDSAIAKVEKELAEEAARKKARLAKEGLTQREVAPERWEEYCNIRDEVDKRASEMARIKLGKSYGQLGTCHTIWYYKSKILKEDYHMDWKSPQVLNPGTMFD